MLNVVLKNTVMKIKNTLLLLVVAAAAAVSCNLFNNWDMDVPMGVDKHANLTPEKLFDVQFDNNLATTPAGDICLSFEPSKGIEKECTLEAGKNTLLGEFTVVADDCLFIDPPVRVGAFDADFPAFVQIDHGMAPFAKVGGCFGLQKLWRTAILKKETTP